MLTRTRAALESQSVSLEEALVRGGLASTVAALLRDLPHRNVTVDPRRPFRDPGAPRDEMIFVRSGILSKFKTDPSGKKQIVALRFAGDGILPREGVSAYGVEAIRKSEVMIAKAEDFDAVVDRSPELARFFWRLVQKHEAIGYEWLVNCGRRDSLARVAHLLCETATRTGAEGSDNAMVNPFTQQQIADITGQTSVNVNRVFADLERQGLIRRQGRHISVPDWAEMRRIAGFQGTYLH